MDDDLLHFIENVHVEEEQNEVTIAIELKNLLEQNDKINIVLELEGKIINKMILGRKNDIKW